MELLDSLKWMIFSQQLYRLALFRTDKLGTKLMTDKWEILMSITYILAITGEVGYIGQKLYFNPAKNFFQISDSESEILP